MTTAYPFSVASDEFKGKRVLVTGGTKGIAFRGRSQAFSIE
jgi:hypothetical protein